MKKIVFAISVCCTVCMNLFAQTHSLATKFGDFVLSNMQPGMVYSLKENREVSFTVVNNAEEQRNIEVRIAPPRESQLREGYESVPDVSWVTVYPSFFSLEPGESMDCDLIISIPHEERYQDRHFQAMIVTESAGRPGGAHGVSINFSLVNRIRFSTGRRPEAIVAEYRDRILSALEMEMMPMSLFVRDKVPVGRPVVFDGIGFPTGQVINRSREDYLIEFELARSPRDYGITSGYSVLPSDVDIEILTEKLKAGARTINDVELKLTIPDKDEYRSEKFVMVIVGQVKGFDIPIEVFSRIYFTTED